MPAIFFRGASAIVLLLSGDTLGSVRMAMGSESLLGVQHAKVAIFYA